MKGKNIWIVLVIMLLICSLCEISVASSIPNEKNREHLEEIFSKILEDNYEKNKELPSGLIKIMTTLELIR
jgi:hypothetical protein